MALQYLDRVAYSSYEVTYLGKRVIGGAFPKSTVLIQFDAGCTQGWPADKVSSKIFEMSPVLKNKLHCFNHLDRLYWVDVKYLTKIS